MAALKAAAAAYGEFREADQEAQRRETQAEQQTLAYAKLAATRLSFSELKVSRTQAGGYGLFGTAANLTGYRITDAIVRIEYFRDGQRVSYQDMRWEQLVGFQRKSFGLPLNTNINYTNVRLVPVRVELGN